MDTEVADAMSEAYDAFKKCLNGYGTDPAYYDIRITVWEKDCNFEHRLRRYEMESECKEKE